MSTVPPGLIAADAMARIVRSVKYTETISKGKPLSGRGRSNQNSNGSSVYLLRITGCIEGSTSGQNWVADVYGNGDQQVATQTGVALRLPMLANSAVAPTGTWLIAFKIGDTFYGEIPTWL